ncbi:MAG: hypothetical protein COY80_01070 [Candidatus Pacebacteria bacterium CG_4_10_14_0_8_um_filter_42_14]|nr:MAG: hypothetical protein COY80_01070 [Candidatus Pacebacteria bacterium CG_4_10_14_0_8_um_filter_42_14]
MGLEKKNRVVVVFSQKKKLENGKIRPMKIESRVRHNIRSAQLLYEQALDANVDHGCVDLSLHSLGASPHLIDLTSPIDSSAQRLLELVCRNGFTPSWMIGIGPRLCGEQIEEILESKRSDLQVPLKGKLAGFLGIEHYEAGPISSHVFSIIPRQHLPRDLRRQLTRQKAYAVFDTNGLGASIITTDDLARYADNVIERGGTFDIVQLRK